MQSRRALQIGLTVVIAGVIAFIFLTGKNKSSAVLEPNPRAKATTEMPEGFDFGLYEKDVIAKLPKKDADEIMIMRGRLSGRGAMNENLLVIAKKYEDIHQPALSGY